MKLLSVSTAESGCSLAIVDGKTLICEEFWETSQTHSRRLMKMIEHLLAERAGMDVDDMDCFVVARGPGSFTGLRIGISVVKGLAAALKKPAVGVSSLDGIGFRFMESAIPVCVMMDARRNEVYSAVYRFQGGRLLSKSMEQVVNPKKVLEINGIDHGAPVLFAGSGARVYKEMIEMEVGKTPPVFAPDFSDGISATALIRSFYAGNQLLNDPASALVPSYIRKSDAELQFS